MLTKRKSVLIAFPIVVLLATVRPAAGQTDVIPDPAQEPKRPDTESELAALIAELDPPTVEEVIASLQPIPTLEEVLAPLPDDPNAPYNKMLKDEDKERVEELEKQITEFRQAAQYANAYEISKKLLLIRKQEQPESHWQVRDVAREVSTLEKAKALELDIQRKLSKMEAAYAGIEDYYPQGRFADAVALTLDVMEIRIQAFGVDYIDLIYDLHNLSAFLRLMGDYEKADIALRSAFSRARKELGIAHPLVGAAVNQIGALQMNLHDYERSHLLHRSSLAIQRNLFGDNHASVGNALHGLCVSLRFYGELESAEAVCRKATITRTNVYGELHHRTAASMESLGLVLLDLAQHSSAEHFLRRALLVKEQLLGPANFLTSQAMQHLGVLLLQQGRYASAEPLFPDFPNGLVVMA